MSINKEKNDFEVIELYSAKCLSLTDISKLTNQPVSTIRNRLIKNGIKLRNRTDAIRQNRHKIGRKGATVLITKEWRKNISKARIRHSELNAKGFSLKPSGYFEATKGQNKDKAIHRIIVEKHINRQLTKDEVVHHINGIRTDNRIENLQLMTRVEHSALHAKENYSKRVKNSKGQFC